VRVPRVPLPAVLPDLPESGWTELSRADGTSVVVFHHRAPGASAVAVSINGWGRPDPVTACDLEPDGTGGWSGAFEVPSDLQASWSFRTHDGDGPAPWHVASAGLHTGPRLVPGDRRLRRATVHEVISLVPERPWLTAYGIPDAATTVPLTPADPADPAEPVVRLWRTPGASADRPVPLVVVFDGEGHVDRLGTPGILGAAHAQGVIPDLVVAFVDAGADRRRDLGMVGGQSAWVARTLVPRLHREGVLGAVSPRRTVVTGASFGGLSSLFALAQSDGLIGAAVAQSVSCWRYPAPDLDVALAEAVGAAGKGGEPTVVRLHAGRYEGNSAVRAGQLAERLRSAGVDATARTVSGGHDWGWWIPEMVTELGAVLG
jgi:enterochelin esterase-like enzyme